MTEFSSDKKRKIVAYWLLVGVFMIIVQIIIGGVTRLTGSGLSITEWKPILGIFPPMNEQEWGIAFEKYQGIAQYKHINYDFTLSDFKFIYFWEWFHRVWARGLGVVFAIPFIYFIVKKYFTNKMIFPLLLLFILGGLQGFVGWIMVQSGLNDTDLYVSHIRLAIHFISALILLVYTFWFALKLLVPEGQQIVATKMKRLLAAILVILTVQLIYGAFMAGLHAGAAAPTWPDINGSFAPPTLFNDSWIDSRLNIQFIHRTLAYILLILLVYAAIELKKVSRNNPEHILLKKSIWWPFTFVVLQITLGVFAVLTSMTIVKGHFGTYELLAELHQIVALFLLLAIVYVYYLVRKKAVN